MTNEPHYITLADGTLIDARSGKRTASTEINKAFSDQPNRSSFKRTSSDYEGGTRRYLDDLPVPAPQSRAVAIVTGYTLFGLSSADIAHILGIDMEVVDGIVQSDAYNQFLEAILQNVREHDNNIIRRKINASAEDAVNKITELVNDKKPDIALKASQDILNRVAGDGLSDSTSSNRNSGGLTIRIVDERANPLDKVVVDIDG